MEHKQKVYNIGERRELLTDSFLLNTTHTTDLCNADIYPFRVLKGGESL